MILVTGAAGFIGSNFLHYIHKRTDEEIVVVDNLTYASDIKFIDKLIDNKRVKFIQVDIGDEQAVDELFVSYKPNTVFHFAAESHVDSSIKNYRPFVQANILGTINLLNASRDVVDKFHHISTDEVYGSLEYDDPNIFTEVRPTLRLMLQQFRRLPLTSSFDSDVNDFLFESEPLIPLPTTPQPVVNTQINAQQIDPNTNLTRTQQALLSPTEQVIASRRRT